MTCYHAFWTKPLLKPDTPPDTQELFVWDFEALTWLLSVLEIRRHSEIRLVTDLGGELFAKKAGLEWAYNGGISTVLDDIPAEIDAQVFWAAGKLFAHRVMTPPCACLDSDAVLWRPLQPSSPLIARHPENQEWSWYKADETQFRRFGFDQPGWDWTVDPVNAAVVAFLRPELKELYTDMAIKFMVRYSQDADARDLAVRVPGALLNDPMIFAEQRLLAMCAALTGERIGFITQAHVPGVCIYRNPDCLHLWGSKLAYRTCRDARVAIVNHLIEFISNRFPEANATLTAWGMDRPKTLDPCSPGAVEEPTAWHAGGLTFSLLRNVRGVVWIQDPNVDVRRRATEGCMIWSADIIQPEPGASFELVVAGQCALEFRQM